MKGIKFGTKITGGFLIMIVLLIIVGFAGYNGMEKAKKAKLISDELNFTIKYILEARRHEKNFILRRDHVYIEKVKKNVIKIGLQVKKLKNDIDDPQEINQLDAIQKSAKEYEKSFLDYVNIYQKQADFDNALVQSARRVESTARELLAMQQKEHARLQTAVVATSEIKAALKIADEINNIIDWLLSCRRHEKNFIIRGEDEYIERVSQYVNKIIQTSEGVRKQLEDPEAKKQATEITDKINAYSTSFDNYVNLVKTIKNTNWNMVLEARNAQKVCENTQKAQQEKLEKQLVISLWIIGACLLVAIIIGGILAFVITRGIINPVNLVIDGLKKIAQGDADLTSRLTIKSNDEAGELAKWFNIFLDKQQNMIKSIVENTEVIRNSAHNLLDLSKGMSDGSGEMMDVASNVSSVTEQMSVNLTSVSAATEQSATNIDTITQSADQMSASITDISKNTDEAHNITQKAVIQAKTTSHRIDALGEKTREINKVTEAITNISEQTNLLALNATIEAARAGEAGKGFAVVANEIKDLAQQTSTATDDIRHQIESIQESMYTAVDEINDILNVINRVNDIVSIIASAVEQQNGNTQEIAENMHHMSLAIREVNQNLTQLSSASTHIVQDMTNLSQTANLMNNSSFNVDENSNELSSLSSTLYEMVKKFKV